MVYPSTASLEKAWDMIHTFAELRQRYRNDVEHRYSGAEIDEVPEIEEVDPGDEFLASATPDELMRLSRSPCSIPARPQTPSDRRPGNPA